MTAANVDYLAAFLSRRMREDQVEVDMVDRTRQAGPDWIARRRAEVDAKVRIAVRCQEMLAAPDATTRYLATQTLVDLARIYSDHKDWRTDWPGYQSTQVDALSVPEGEL